MKISGNINPEVLNRRIDLCYISPDGQLRRCLCLRELMNEVQDNMVGKVALNYERLVMKLLVNVYIAVREVYTPKEAKYMVHEILKIVEKDPKNISRIMGKLDGMTEEEMKILSGVKITDEQKRSALVNRWNEVENKIITSALYLKQLNKKMVPFIQEVNEIGASIETDADINYFEGEIVRVKTKIETLNKEKESLTNDLFS